MGVVQGTGGLLVYLAAHFEQLLGVTGVVVTHRILLDLAVATLLEGSVVVARAGLVLVGGAEGSSGLLDLGDVLGTGLVLG
ncbi:hypothetical protein D3C79_879070 [compost metagenome]